VVAVSGDLPDRWSIRVGFNLTLLVNKMVLQRGNTNYCLFRLL